MAFDAPMAEKRRAFMAILPCFHAVPTRQVPGTDHLGARANQQPITDAQARVFISSLDTVILSSAPRSLKPRDSSAGGSRDGRPPPSLPPPPVSARADGRLSRGTASPCACVCMCVCARAGLDGNSPLRAALLRHRSGVPPVSVTLSHGAFTHRWIPFVQA